MYMCIYIYIFCYVYIYQYIFIHIYLYIYIYIHMHTHTYMHIKNFDHAIFVEAVDAPGLFPLFPFALPTVTPLSTRRATPSPLTPHPLTLCSLPSGGFRLFCAPQLEEWQNVCRILLRARACSLSPALSCSLSLSHTHTRTLTPTLARTLSLLLSLSLSLLLSLFRWCEHSRN